MKENGRLKKAKVEANEIPDPPPENIKTQSSDTSVRLAMSVQAGTDEIPDPPPEN